MSVLGVLAAIALSAASSASAATEVGNTCAADIGHANVTEIQLAKAPGEAAPITVPAAGVVTQWKANLVQTESVMPQRMRVFRATGNPNEFTAVAETSLQLMVAGANVFETRIPVEAGDRFGAHGPLETLTCTTGNPADSMGTFSGNALVGSTQTFSPGSGERVAVSAIVEPDVDRDGYGDETQDQCPQKASLQTACPTITLDAFPIVLKRSVLLLVGASSTSSVQVFGQVGWRLRPTPRDGARSSKKVPPPGKPKPTGQVIGLAGGTQTVNPGEVARFNVKLPKSVTRRLKQLPPSKSVKGTLSAATTDLAGRTSTKVVTIRLPGQKRPGS